jgi:ubiquinone/menaquinone biosynthesis C-methylase UbiE
MITPPQTISPISRRKGDARRLYDRLSGYYDWFSGPFERRPALKVLEWLNIQSGEAVLEIGFGTGYCLSRIALTAGLNTMVCGLDFSGGMVNQARKRLAGASLLSRVTLCQGDAVQLPFRAETFAVVFLSFTLELFATPEIPVVLAEIRRVLKPGGRLGIVSLFRQRSPAVNLYEWAHRRWPRYLDCRPICPDQLLSAGGFEIVSSRTMRLVVLPVALIAARKGR